jgi:hypothetical protein
MNDAFQAFYSKLGCLLAKRVLFFCVLPLLSVDFFNSDTAGKVRVTKTLDF